MEKVYIKASELDNCIKVEIQNRDEAEVMAAAVYIIKSISNTFDIPEKDVLRVLTKALEFSNKED